MTNNKKRPISVPDAPGTSRTMGAGGLGVPMQGRRQPSALQPLQVSTDFAQRLCTPFRMIQFATPSDSYFFHYTNIRNAQTPWPQSPLTGDASSFFCPCSSLVCCSSLRFTFDFSLLFDLSLFQRLTFYLGLVFPVLGHTQRYCSPASLTCGGHDMGSVRCSKAHDEAS